MAEIAEIFQPVRLMFNKVEVLSNTAPADKKESRPFDGASEATEVIIKFKDQSLKDIAPAERKTKSDFDVRFYLSELWKLAVSAIFS